MTRAGVEYYSEGQLEDCNRGEHVCPWLKRLPIPWTYHGHFMTKYFGTLAMNLWYFNWEAEKTFLVSQSQAWHTRTIIFKGKFFAKNLELVMSVDKFGKKHTREWGFSTFVYRNIGKAVAILELNSKMCRWKPARPLSARTKAGYVFSKKCSRGI